MKNRFHDTLVRAMSDGQVKHDPRRWEDDPTEGRSVGRVTAFLRGIAGHARPPEPQKTLSEAQANGLGRFIGERLADATRRMAEALKPKEPWYTVVIWTYDDEQMTLVEAVRAKTPAAALEAVEQKHWGDDPPPSGSIVFRGICAMVYH